MENKSFGVSWYADSWNQLELLLVSLRTFYKIDENRKSLAIIMLQKDFYNESSTFLENF